MLLVPSITGWVNTGLTRPLGRGAPPPVLLGERVAVTAYSSTVDQADATPFITASGQRVRMGIVAVSQDMLRRYPFGTKVELCAGFVVQDTMHPRIKQTADVWMPTRAGALTFGRRWMVLRRVE